MEPLWALGLMSGTSMDGVDAALLRTDGETLFAFGPSFERPYSAEERAVLAAAQGTWPGEGGNALAAAREVIHAAHLDAIRALPPADVIGFHGQTFAHDPAHRRTHQAGDGARLAKSAGVPVVWDFRTADVAAGGQGAPLAPIYHHAAARAAGLAAPVAVLNIGGVANVTWLDPRAGPETMLAFDTGPGNALIDDFVAARTGARFDPDGRLAATGDAVPLDTGADYLSRQPPKSLDRHDFHGALAAVAALSDADGAATLTRLTVDTILAARSHFPAHVARWLVCGGGRRNLTLMRGLEAALECPVSGVEAVGLNGDQLEAQAFAHLAARHLAGLPISYPGTTNVPRPLTGGRLSRP